MSEIPKTGISSEQQIREKSEEELRYFWNHQDSPDLEQSSKYEKRLFFDTQLIILSELPTPNHSYSDERNAAIKAFAQLGWLPKSPAEKRMVTAKDEEEIFETKGPEERLRRATHTSTGQPQRARMATLATIKNYYKDAAGDCLELMPARIIDTHGNTGDVSVIRSSPKILNAIADYLHGREILDKGWENGRNTLQFKQHQKYWRGFMQAAANPDSSSDSLILTVFEAAWEADRSRRDYWREQQRSIGKKVGQLPVSDVQEPSTQPPETATPEEPQTLVQVMEELSQPGLSAGNLENGFLEPPGMPRAIPGIDVIDAYRPKSPIKSIPKKVGESSEASERLFDAPPLAEDEVEPLDPDEAEIIEISKRARNMPPRPPRPARGSKQLEIRDSDKRVQTDRELSGAN